MLGVKNLTVDFLTGTPVLVWLALLGLLALAVFLYYRTNPPIPRYLRIILGILRGIAIVALLAMLLEPVIKYERDFERPRRVSVLLDNSLSMDRVESGLSRKARMDSLLSGGAYSRLNKAASITPLYFGGSLESSPDKVQRERTAIGDALYDLKARQLPEPADAWLLFSDGRSNSGRSVIETASGLGIPVTTIDMSSESGVLDVAIENVDYNAVVFMGQSSEVKVKIKWQGAAGRKITLRLNDGARVLAESDFPITESSGRGDIALKYIPSEPGQRLLNISIPKVEGEESERNNTRTISVKVMKSRLQVLMVTARPDYEVGFLHRHLLRSDKYDVSLKVIGPRAGNLAGRFPSSQTELNRYDLVILYDPDPSSFEGKGPLLKSYMSDKGGAVWVFLGEQFANAGPVKWFNELLPFSQPSRRPLERFDFRGEPSENELFHPAVRLSESRTGIREAWNNLPPFKSLVRCDVIDPNATQLVYALIPTLPGSKTPILGFKRFGPGKLLASAALPFWTWGFANIGFGGNDSTYTGWVEGTVRWLTVRDDFDPIRVLPEKEVFTRGEPIRFNGFAFDQGYRPIPAVGGSVTLKDTQRGTSFDADFIERGEGRLEGTLGQIPPGRYSYVATLRKDGQDLKRVEGTVAVEEFSLEEFDQTGDPQTLSSLARLSGGASYPYSRFDDAIAAMNTTPIKESLSNEIVLWSKLWLLLLFVFCLSAEWAIRKINQLI